MLKDSKKTYPDLDTAHRRYSMVRLLVDRQVTDLIGNTTNNIRSNNITSLKNVRTCDVSLISFSAELKEKIDALKRFLSDQMYHHPHLLEMSEQAGKIIKTLFDRYKREPQKLHGKFKLRLNKEPVEIIIADFIAGMTDRYAYKMYDELK